MMDKSINAGSGNAVCSKGKASGKGSILRGGGQGKGFDWSGSIEGWGWGDGMEQGSGYLSSVMRAA